MQREFKERSSMTQKLQQNIEFKPEQQKDLNPKRQSAARNTPKNWDFASSIKARFL